MSKNNCRVAIIGLGVVGNRMVTNMKEHPFFDPVIGYDPSEHARNNIKVLCPDFTCVDNAQSIFSRTDIDLLYVSTPPFSHAQYVRRGIKNGWGIFCEKPLGIDISDSTCLTNEIGRTDLLQAVNFVFSGAKSSLRAKSLLEEGFIGDVVGAEFSIKFAKWPREWQSDAVWLAGREEGGMLREVGSHYAFLTQFLFGEVRGYKDCIINYTAPDKAENLVMARWRIKGTQVTVNASVGGNRQDIVRYRVLGTKGCLVFENWYQLFHETALGMEPLINENQSTPLSAYMGQLDRLALQINDGIKRLANFEDALAVQKLIETMLLKEKQTF